MEGIYCIVELVMMTYLLVTCSSIPCALSTIYLLGAYGELIADICITFDLSMVRFLLFTIFLSFN